jgi:acyl-CoA synthetase (AMP-forming)/AMP-acid ligase II
MPDQITLLFALARIGAVLVPLNFRLAPRGVAGGAGRLHADAACCTMRHGPMQAALALAQAAGSACRTASTR